MDCEASVDVVVAISSTEGLVEARQLGRNIAMDMGFSASQSTLIAAAISELARNIVQYAYRGEICLRREGPNTLVLIARDSGPGIADMQAALRPGYSTSGGLGLGLPGLERIADRFDVVSDSTGTTVTLGMTRR
jgi:serine/threonine-protein kinase RsbT